MQPVYPVKMSMQPVIMNPDAQKILWTTFVDSLPGDQSQSMNKLRGIMKPDAKNGTTDSVPFLIMPNPKTSCMNDGM